MPKVSVIIPAYNAERFIAQTLDSVLGQTFHDYEVLVIDDGSTDSTAALALACGAPVRCLQQTNGGVSRARNMGMEQAAGEYLAFLDADDVWEPRKLEKQVKLLDARPDIGLCFVGMQRVDPEMRLIEEVEARDYEDFCEALLLYSCVVAGSCSSAMVRREVAAQAGGFDFELSTGADWDYWLRLSLLAKFAPIAEPLVKYRVFSGSMSSDPKLVERDTFAALDKFYSAEPPPRYVKLKHQSYSNHWIILSGCHLHAGNRRDSLRCLINGLKLYPLNFTKPMGLPVRWLKRRMPLNHP